MKKYLFACLLFLAGCSQKNSKVSLAVIPVKQGDYWGYVDQTGKFLINPQFKEAFAFQDGLALIKTTQNLYGFIDEKGKLVIPAVYKEAAAFSESLAAVVKENQQIEYINTNGETEFTLAPEIDETSSFHEGLARVQSLNKYGFVDKSGKLVIPCQYESAGDFSEGLSLMATKAKDKYVWGYINKDGKVTINPQFESASDFSGGKAAIKSGDKYGYIDKEGKIVITPQFDYAGEFKEGLAVAKQGELQGYINEEGKFAINPQFNAAGNFTENGLAAIKSTTNNKWGFINKEGKVVIDPQFENVSSFIDNVAISALGEKYGLIDKEGKYKFNPQFDEIATAPVFFSQIESDFFDGSSIIGLIFNNYSTTAFKGVSKTSDFALLSKSFPEITHESYNYFSPGAAAEENKYLALQKIGFAFNDGFVNSKPRYRNETRYNYYTYSYYTTAVYDGTDYSYNDQVSVNAMALYYELKGKALSKSDKLLDMIKNKIPAAFQKEYKEGQYLLLTNPGGYYIKLTVDGGNLNVIMSFNKDRFAEKTENYTTTTDSTTMMVDTTSN